MGSTTEGLYKKLQIAVLDQLPNRGDLRRESVENWLEDQESLKKALYNTLREYRGSKTEPKDEKKIAEKIYRFTEIRNGKLWINLAADPFIPEGWSIPDGCHKKGDGWWEFNPDAIKDFLSDEQQKGNSIGGYKLREIMRNQPSFNANLIDGLLERPEFIPKDWKDGKYRFAWGTIYRNAYGSLDVRCLDLDGVQPYWRCFWPGLDFNPSCPAMVALNLIL
ncbi:MAG: hypothetical protein PHR00_01235 [Patescibacteria group bacterium]|nr:hypothetical protein [Patescibacteria group bacterium]